MGPRLRPRRWLLCLISIVFLGWPSSASAQEDTGAPPEPQPYQPGDVVPAPPSEEEEEEEEEPIDEYTEELVDPYGKVTEGPKEQISSQVRYILERIDVRGQKRTKAALIRKFVPLNTGEFFDPESPDLVATEWRLMGTGWFDRVDIHLERGSQPGYVVMVVDVKERNTVVVEQLVAGLAEGTPTSRALVPWLGFKVTETNLAGLGMRLSGTALLSELQQGGRLDFRYPKLIKDQWGIRFATYFLNGREFFGNRPVVSVPCGMPECPGTTIVDNAVVRYRRGGFMVGTGKDLTSTLRYSLDWIGDIVSVLDRPEAASEQRGNEISPIDFSIADGRSFVSLLRFALIFDRRDDPGITKEGVLLRGVVTAGTRFLGSDYDFLQLDAWVRRWWRLPWTHTIRIGAFAGAAFGNTPFFYLYHVSDLTDLIPSRFLEMQLDRRPPPNLLNTSIENNRLGELAWRLDLGYNVPVYERVRDRGLREINLYTLVGLYSLAKLRDPRTGVSGYTGASRFPIDLTFDFGFRFDTRAGVFQVGFSTLLGFIRL